MKKLLLSFTALALCLMMSICVYAKGEKNETPSLDSISFNNATINEAFSKDVFEYTVTLEEPIVTPTLKSYKINGNANIFVTYEENESKHQSGILVTLEYENGAVYYKFKYTNAPTFDVNSNNLLASAGCRLGEVYPKLNDSQTSYKLYIPKDLTELEFAAAAKDTGAVCEYIKSYNISTDQEPTIQVTVTATDNSVRVYTFQVKRLKKTCKEVQEIMDSPDFDSLVKGELFWQKPSYIIGFACVIAGLILILIFVKIAKRLTVTVGDEDEELFFASEE